MQNLPVPFDRRVWLEATTLQAAGYSVSIVCPKAKGYTRSREVIEDVQIHRYGLPVDARGPAGYAFEFAWCFLRTFFKSLEVVWFGRGFDAIHACNPPDTYWILGRLFRPFGKRFLFDHHDLSPEMYVAKFGDRSTGTLRGLRLLERMTFRSADVVIATNESHKQVAVERGGVPANRIFVVRSGPDVGRLTRYPPDPAWKRGKEFLIVYLGEICAQDGVEYLVRAVKTLRDELRRDDFHCVLVGGGPHQQAIREYAAAQGVLELCTFTGRVSDEELCRVLSSADVAIDPDPKTPWSDQSTMNKIMEYMFFGLPIVGFDLDESRVSAAGSAVFAESNDEREMAKLVAELLDDPTRRAEMSRIGMERIERELSWEHSVPPLLSAYDALFTQD